MHGNAPDQTPDDCGLNDRPVILVTTRVGRFRRSRSRKAVRVQIEKSRTRYYKEA